MSSSIRLTAASLPMRERGLKYQLPVLKMSTKRVAPHAGAWIEIQLVCIQKWEHIWSLPMRERGLKYLSWHKSLPLGVWSLPMRERGLKSPALPPLQRAKQSLPMRERGLKLYSKKTKGYTLKVAPHAGAWIEMAGMCYSRIKKARRSPCGSVD